MAFMASMALFFVFPMSSGFQATDHEGGQLRPRAPERAGRGRGLVGTRRLDGWGGKAHVGPAGSRWLGHRPPTGSQYGQTLWKQSETWACKFSVFVSFHVSCWSHFWIWRSCWFYSTSWPTWKFSVRSVKERKSYELFGWGSWKGPESGARHEWFPIYADASRKLYRNRLRLFQSEPRFIHIEPSNRIPHGIPGVSSSTFIFYPDQRARPEDALNHHHGTRTTSTDGQSHSQCLRWLVGSRKTGKCHWRLGSNMIIDHPSQKSSDWCFGTWLDGWMNFSPIVGMVIQSDLSIFNTGG